MLRFHHCPLNLKLKTAFFLWLHQPPADMELTYACLGMSSNTTTAPVPPSVPCDTRRRGWFSVSCKDHADNRERSQAITWRPAAHVVKHECLQGRVCECVRVCVVMFEDDNPHSLQGHMNERKQGSGLTECSLSFLDR